MKENKQPGMKDYGHGELAKDILKGLAVGGFIVACLALPRLPQVMTLFRVRGSHENYRFMRTVKTLQKRRLVRIYERDGEEVIEITELGKKKVLAYNLDDMTLKKPKRWDKIWHIVMFDIPHTRKRARDAVSRKVKELGLYPIQKSVFISPYSCKDEIDFIGEFFGVRKYIIYMTVLHTEGEGKLKRHFKLTV